MSQDNNNITNIEENDVNVNLKDDGENTQNTQNADVIKDSNQINEDITNTGLSNHQAMKIRKKTEEKVARRYKNQIAELQSKLSSQRDEVVKATKDNKVFDDFLGDWIPSDISGKEYKSLLANKVHESNQLREAQEIQKPVQENLFKVCSEDEKAESTLINARKNNILSAELTLIAGNLGYDATKTLVDLARNNPQVLRELSNTPTYLMSGKLMNIVHSRKNVNKNTKVDAPHDHIGTKGSQSKNSGNSDIDEDARLREELKNGIYT